MTTAIFPGSFDPPTNGHIDLVERALTFTERLVVVVFSNLSKKHHFTVEERVHFWEQALTDTPRLTIDTHSGLLVDYATSNDCQSIVKGLRTGGDYEYEQQMALMNRHQTGIETVFISSAPEWSFVSSSLVMEVARLGGTIDRLVPPVVAEAINRRFR